MFHSIAKAVQAMFVFVFRPVVRWSPLGIFPHAQSSRDRHRHTTTTRPTTGKGMLFLLQQVTTRRCGDQNLSSAKPSSNVLSRQLLGALSA